MDVLVKVIETQKELLGVFAFDLLLLSGVRLAVMLSLERYICHVLLETDGRAGLGEGHRLLREDLHVRSGRRGPHCELDYRFEMEPTIVVNI